MAVNPGRKKRDLLQQRLVQQKNIANTMDRTYFKEQELKRKTQLKF